MPTKQQTTNTTPTIQGRTNGRCTGNKTHCTQWDNIHTEEDFNRENSSTTCTLENNGVSNGRSQHAQRIDDTIIHNNGSYQGNTHSSGRGGKVVFQCHPNFISGVREGDGVVSSNGPYHGHSPYISRRSTTTNGTNRAATHYKLCKHKKQLKYLSNKTAIVEDDLDIMMLQDTRYKR